MGFIETIAPLIVKYAPQYDIKVVSPIIAQAVLESASGTSELAVNACNYFGLKYRSGRCPTCSGTYTKVGSEQNQDGSYSSEIMLWCLFTTMENGVKGYFDFINVSTYANLKGVTDPATYLKNIKADGYATSQNYVANLMAVICRYNLTQYDPQEETDMSSIKVAVDAGHGSQTAGKRTPDGYREHWINVKTAYYCAKALEANGIEVYKSAWNDLNATDDSDIALTTRQKNIKAERCDYSISCHANAYGGTWNSAQGVETLIHSNTSYVKDSKALADKVQARLIQGTTQKNRGVKTQTLAMCNCSAMGTNASVLVEIGFMTNSVEAQLMQTDDFCKEQGEDIAKGFCDYLGISYKDPNTTISTVNTGTTTTTTYTTLQQKGIAAAKQFVGSGLKDTLAKMKVQVLQTAINNDYKAGLVVDGAFGTKSANALGTHYVKKGEKQYMVTAAEILMYLNDLDPNGIEYPGSYGNGLVKAAKKKFGGLGTKITATNFKTLIL